MEPWPAPYFSMESKPRATSAMWPSLSGTMMEVRIAPQSMTEMDAPLWLVRVYWVTARPSGVWPKGLVAMDMGMPSFAYGIFIVIH